MSLADTTLNIGGIEIKGMYVVMFLTIASSIGGFVWSASTLYGRLEAVESISIPDIEPLSKRFAIIEQQLSDNDISELQGKLAALGTNLNTIIEQQSRLLTIQDQVIELDQSIAEMDATVKKAELITGANEGVSSDIDALKREVNDLWQGLDYLSDPYSAE